MKIAIMASLLAKGDMYVNSCHAAKVTQLYFLNKIETFGKVALKQSVLL